MKDYFQSAAGYYKAYRPFYPEDVLSHIVTTVPLSLDDRVLDIGAGTGHLLIGLAPFVKEIVAVEPDPDMLTKGKELVQEHGVQNVRWVNTSAELIDEITDLGKIKAATFGASFHWMDQEQVLNLLHRILEPDGAVVVTGSKSVWRPTEDWEGEMKKVIQLFLGAERRAGTGTYLTSAKTDKRFEDLLRGSPFSELHEFHTTFDRTHTAESYIGRMLSTSFANPAVLGDKQPSFENAIRAKFNELSDDGTLIKHDEYYALIAKRP